MLGAQLLKKKIPHITSSSHQNLRYNIVYIEENSPAAIGSSILSITW